MGASLSPLLPPERGADLEKTFADYPAVKRVILFGSRAMGRERPNSDIDLCLDAPDMAFADFLRLSAHVEDLVFPYSLDMLLYHHIDNPKLIDHIDRVGVVIYEANKDYA